MLGVVHLGVELHAVEPPLLVGDGGVGADGGARRVPEALGRALHIVAVAHPGSAALGEARKERAGGVEPSLRAAVFARGIALGLDDAPAQGLRHELAAVADAEHGHAEGEDAGVDLGRAGRVDAPGPAGEYDAYGRGGFKLRERRGVRPQLAVYAALADAPGDELVVLPAEVKDDNCLVLHGLLFLSSPRISHDRR